MSELYEGIVEDILEGRVSEVERKVQLALDQGIEPGEILQKGLIAGMDEVGALFKEGELFVPEVLVSAKAMKAGLEILRPHLANTTSAKGAKILTVTVEGDLHDIGVKLVGMMLEGAGYEVENLGVDVPAKTIVEAVAEKKPQILGLSAMLTTTMAHMKSVIDALKEASLYDSVKVMVGGAPVSPVFASQIGAHYAADANEAVLLAKKLLSVA